MQNFVLYEAMFSWDMNYYSFCNGLLPTCTESFPESVLTHHRRCSIPDSKVRGANMGPIWGQQDTGGPHVGPINFAISYGINMSFISQEVLMHIIPDMCLKITIVKLLLQLPGASKIAVAVMFIWHFPASQPDFVCMQATLQL